MSNTAKVVDFTEFHAENFSAKEIRIPKISKHFEDAIKQVRPLFEEWLHADHVFEHNTIEVAKAISAAWSIFKGTEGATKVAFARYFDSTIPADAVTRDVVGNATFNRIQYLLHKVIPAGEGTNTMSAAERSKQREKDLRREWKAFVRKYKQENVELAEIQEAVTRLLRVFMTESAVERVIDAA